jgi:thiol:disulfide interchange protein
MTILLSLVVLLLFLLALVFLFAFLDEKNKRTKVIFLLCLVVFGSAAFFVFRWETQRERLKQEQEAAMRDAQKSVWTQYKTRGYFKLDSPTIFSSHFQ